MAGTFGNLGCKQGLRESPEENLSNLGEASLKESMFLDAYVMFVIAVGSHRILL